MSERAVPGGGSGSAGVSPRAQGGGARTVPLRVRSIVNPVTIGRRTGERDSPHPSRTEPAHRRFGFTHTLNPYRGCVFACRYCYARYTHEWLGLDGDGDFDQRIHLKEDITEVLRRDLGRLRRRGRGGDPIGAIAFGTATDPYQPVEAEYGLTRACLEVFAEEEGWSLELTTKSTLIARDIELLRRVARRNEVLIHVTVTTVDRALARILEPGAPSPRARIETIASLTAAGLTVEPFVAPLIPGINDATEALDQLFRELKEVGARRVIGEALFLRSPTREVFLRSLQESFPSLVTEYRRRFAESAFLSPVDAERLRARVERLRVAHGLLGGRGDDARARSPRRGSPRTLPRRPPPRGESTGPEQLGLIF